MIQLFSACFLILSLFGSSILQASEKISVAVTIPPIQTFVEAIGGELVEVVHLVPAGQDLHTFAPKPSKMREMLDVKQYFKLGGIMAEDIWLERLVSLNPSMKVMSITQGIERIEMDAHHHHEEEVHHEEEEKSETSYDPHIWLAPSNVKKMGVQILEHLLESMPENEIVLNNNYEKFISDVAETDSDIRKILSDSDQLKGFLVFHPAWGYFAKDYGLSQFSVELEGKEPSPGELMEQLKEARTLGIRNIWIQPQRSSRMAESLAKSLGGKLIVMDPLSTDWSNTLKKAAWEVAKSYE
jgi:zinc transport system substrate-binding protein